jgi:hypothetical protein
MLKIIICNYRYHSAMHPISFQEPSKLETAKQQQEEKEGKRRRKKGERTGLDWHTSQPKHIM